MSLQIAWREIKGDGRLDLLTTSPPSPPPPPRVSIHHLCVWNFNLPPNVETDLKVGSLRLGGSMLSDLQEAELQDTRERPVKDECGDYVFLNSKYIQRLLYPFLTCSTRFVSSQDLDMSP